MDSNDLRIPDEKLHKYEICPCCGYKIKRGIDGVILRGGYVDETSDSYEVKVVCPHCGTSIKKGYTIFYAFEILVYDKRIVDSSFNNCEITTANGERFYYSVSRNSVWYSEQELRHKEMLEAQERKEEAERKKIREQQELLKKELDDVLAKEIIYSPAEKKEMEEKKLRDERRAKWAKIQDKLYYPSRVFIAILIAAVLFTIYAFPRSSHYEASFDTEYSHFFTGPKHDHWYTFSVPEAGRVNVNIYDDYHYKVANYYVFKADDTKNIIAYSTSQDYFYNNAVFLEKGDYCLLVNPLGLFDSAISKYKLTLTFEPTSKKESENNNSISKADKISANDATKGTLKDSKDIDYYKIKTEDNDKTVYLTTNFKPGVYTGKLDLAGSTARQNVSSHAIIQIKVYSGDNPNTVVNEYTLTKYCITTELTIGNGDYVSISSEDLDESFNYYIYSE